MTMENQTNVQLCSSQVDKGKSDNQCDIHMMVLGHYKAALVGTWWYWVSKGRFWLVLGGTGPV